MNFADVTYWKGTRSEMIDETNPQRQRGTPSLTLRVGITTG